MMEDDKEMDDQSDDMAESGRGGDTVMAHLSLGELVIPRAFLDDPQIMEQMKALFEQAGVNINEFMVGDQANKINPETGYPEFFFKKLTKIFKAAAPIAASFIPGIGPLAGAALGAGLGAATGGGLKGALAGGLTGYSGAGGGSILGGALGAGSKATASALGSALLGAGAGGISGGAKGALLGGAIGGTAGYANAGGFNDLYKGSALQDAVTSASGALDKTASGVSDLYNGSQLQSAFKSGGDALKSVGIDTAGSASAPTPAVGGGQSFYNSESSLPQNFSLSLGNNDYSGALAPTALNGTVNAGATEVAKQGAGQYITPVLSALLGSSANKDAEKAALASQEANKQLLAPYANGFSFNPGDLTQEPGYQANLAAGTKAAERAQLARGGYFSGAAAKELTKYAGDLADETYGYAFNRALQGRQMGLTGALATAGVNDTIGGTKAKTVINQGNLYSGALGSLLGGGSINNTGALQGGLDIQQLLRQLQMQKQGFSSYGV